MHSSRFQKINYIFSLLFRLSKLVQVREKYMNYFNIFHFQHDVVLKCFQLLNIIVEYLKLLMEKYVKTQID
jgi:hypothetical protein